MPSMSEMRPPGAERVMRYVVGGMMVVFALTGLGLFAAGVFGLLRRLKARHRLRAVAGEIIRVEIRQDTDRESGGRAKVYHFPEIRFRSEERGETTFLSEVGAGASQAKYVVGQKIEVLYDPDDKLRPMIRSWAGMWWPPLLKTIVGPVFVGGALLIYYAFGDRIFGK